ncbi:MAG: glycosyltransferase [Flavobacteriales bacterium]|nr:glycosyltransferase [Flavobacteriales bacterium]
MKKRVASIVLNPFVNDNRVYKIANSLQQNGFEVMVVALHKRDLPEREVKDGIPVHRIKLKSIGLKEGNDFYGLIKFIEFYYRIIKNYRRYDILHCNDLLGFVAGVFTKITRPRIKLVYDSHEYQREVFRRNKTQKAIIWCFERLFISWAHAFITVGDGIAKEYQRLYKVKSPVLILNAPHLSNSIRTDILRMELGIPSSEKIFLYQGGLTVSRGMELLLEVFSELGGSGCSIVFMGNGEFEGLIRSYCEKFSNIYFRPSVPYHQLVEYTASADYGIISTQNLCLNNFYCMPNKLFEYIQAEVPILTNNLYECKRIVAGENLGVVIEEYTSPKLKDAIRKIVSVPREQFVVNLKRIKKDYCWENEEKKLIHLYRNL